MLVVPKVLRHLVNCIPDPCLTKRLRRNEWLAHKPKKTQEMDRWPYTDIIPTVQWDNWLDDGGTKRSAALKPAVLLTAFPATDHALRLGEEGTKRLVPLNFSKNLWYSCNTWGGAHWTSVPNSFHTRSKFPTQSFTCNTIGHWKTLRWRILSITLLLFIFYYFSILVSINICPPSRLLLYCLPAHFSVLVCLFRVLCFRVPGFHVPGFQMNFNPV